jgi:hypothetical protein
MNFIEFYAKNIEVWNNRLGFTSKEQYYQTTDIFVK